MIQVKEFGSSLEEPLEFHDPDNEAFVDDEETKNKHSVDSTTQTEESLEDHIKATKPLKLLSQYFEETTVHGIKYIVKGDRIHDRLFWLLVVLATFFATFEINRAYLVTASKNPLAISLSTVPVSNVPFPAVTVSAGKVWNPMGYVRKALSGFQIDAEVDCKIAKT